MNWPDYCNLHRLCEYVNMCAARCLPMIIGGAQNEMGCCEHRTGEMANNRTKNRKHKNKLPEI